LPANTSAPRSLLGAVAGSGRDGNPAPASLPPVGAPRAS
jgi:hypothetical protein